MFRKRSGSSMCILNTLGSITLLCIKWSDSSKKHFDFIYGLRLQITENDIQVCT